MTTAIIKAENGLHARPASLIVNEANKFESDIFIEVEGNKYNCKSIISVMSSKLSCGDEVTINAVGEDSSDAESKILELLNSITE